jgi:hypothetical protein
MKKPKRSAKAPAAGKGNASSRQQVRALTRRVNVPRRSKRPTERSGQRRSRPKSGR